MPDRDATVLVTGGSGFLGGWCIAALLADGYAVRTTVRDPGREQAVRSALARAGVDAAAGGRLTLLAADLGAGAGWAEAAEGCDYVLHVASPFPPSQPKDPDELIVPARDGALRVLRAGLDAGARRIVMTSSVAAVRHGRPPSPDAPYTEEDWTDGNDPERTPYTRSKTIAERSAWDLVEERGERERLAVVNPGAIIGPATSTDRSFSLQAVERLLGSMPAVPRLSFSFVDVRDVADLHLRAMTADAAGGERFIATTKLLWFADVAAILHERLGPAGAKVPTRVAPDILIRALGLFDSSVRSVTGDLGKSADYSSEKARSMLGWDPRPIEDTVVETAQSLFDLGVVKRPGG